jgi:hypothetical protein
MQKFLVPGAVSAVVGAVRGVVAVFGFTAALSDNTRPEINHSYAADESLMNQVEYGGR